MANIEVVEGYDMCAVINNVPDGLTTFVQCRRKQHSIPTAVLRDIADDVRASIPLAANGTRISNQYSNGAGYIIDPETRTMTIDDGKGKYVVLYWEKETKEEVLKFVLRTMTKIREAEKWM